MSYIYTKPKKRKFTFIHKNGKVSHKTMLTDKAVEYCKRTNSIKLYGFFKIVKHKSKRKK